MICGLCRIIFKVSIYFWVSSVAQLFDKLWGKFINCFGVPIDGNYFQIFTSSNSTEKKYINFDRFSREFFFFLKVYENKTQVYYFSKWNKRSSYDMWRWLTDTKKRVYLSRDIFVGKCNLNINFWTIRYFHFIFAVLNFGTFSCISLKSFVSEIWTWKSVFFFDWKIMKQPKTF
jgi:hypothetical protein